MWCVYVCDVHMCVCVCSCVVVLGSFDRINFHVAFSKVFSVGYSFSYSLFYIGSHSSAYVTLPVPLLPFPLNITCILPPFSWNSPMVPNYYFSFYRFPNSDTIIEGFKSNIHYKRENVVVVVFWVWVTSLTSTNLPAHLNFHFSLQLNNIPLCNGMLHLWVLQWRGPHSFRHLNTWSPVCGAVWRGLGGTALMEDYISVKVG